ncbi:hypothetical protein, partial [Xenorhabdus littoralis]|uniref:hypothetical protein n=1 Tax=Xenorhabdus littoralis TaxID=2582835 RepID=UPI0029E7D335
FVTIVRHEISITAEKTILKHLGKLRRSKYEKELLINLRTYCYDTCKGTSHLRDISKKIQCIHHGIYLSMF